MCICFDYSTFPIVNVIITSSKFDETDLELFKEGWLHCYTYNLPWTFIIDITNICAISAKNAFKISKFIKSLERLFPPGIYLEKTLLVGNRVNSSFDCMLRIIMQLNTFTSPVYLIYSNDPVYINAVLHIIHTNGPLPKPNKKYLTTHN